MTHRPRGAKFALASVAVVAVVALCAFGSSPASVAGAPVGYSSKGQLVVQTSIGGAGNEITVGGDIALEERGSFLRLDLLSLAIPGTDATISSLLSTQLFPAGGFTIVYDRTAGTYTVWSPSKHTYYTSAAASANAPAKTSAPAPTAAALGAVGDLFGAFAFAKSVQNDSAFTASVSLAGHGVVNGHPATGLDYHYARTTTAGQAIDVHGRFQLADDLDAIPVQITASGKGQAFPQSSFRLDLTSLARAAVPDADFAVPAGFARAAQIGDVLGKTLPL